MNELIRETRAKIKEALAKQGKYAEQARAAAEKKAAAEAKKKKAEAAKDVILLREANNEIAEAEAILEETTTETPTETPKNETKEKCPTIRSRAATYKRDVALRH